MKTLFIAILLLLSFGAMAQVDTIEIDENPRTLSVGDTTVTLIMVNRRNLRQSTPILLTVLIKAPSTNSGTILINVLGEPTANSLALAAGESIWLTIKDRFYIEQSVGADDLIVSW